MRSRSPAAVAVAAALTACALAVALPFRARVLAQAAPLHYSWDGALHVLAGLDLADDLRRLAPGPALARLLVAHWWGPLWALATAPFSWLFGAGLGAATLPSLLAYALTPAVAWLFARRAAGASAWLAAPLLLVFLLRASVLLEASAWPMFESVGGLLSLLAWLLFATNRRRPAFAVAAALFFLKYHYGVFLGATLLLATLAELTHEERRGVARRARALLSRPLPAAFLALVGLLAAWRFATEKAPPRFLPSVSNIAWGALVVATLAALLARRAATEAWRALPAPLRDFALFSCAAPALWLLDPANVRAFWRQIHQDWVANPPGPLQNARDLLSFLRDDYTASPWTIPLLVIGLGAALALGKGPLRFAALFALWPPAAMCFAAFPLEPRFLGCLLPTLYACAAAGLVLLARGRAVPAIALALAALAPLPFVETRWEKSLAERVRFGYPNLPDEDRFAAALLDALPRGRAIAVALPPGLKLGPTLRLALRLRERGLAPDEIQAGDESAATLLDDLPRRTRVAVLAAPAGSDPGAGFRVVSRTAGPPLPDGGATEFLELAR